MIDWSRVEELRSEVGDDGFDEVVALFLSEVAQVIDRLANATDPARLEQDLHFLKGSALNLGFERLAALCAAGERRAAAGAAVDIAAVLACHAESCRAFQAGQSAKAGRAVGAGR